MQYNKPTNRSSQYNRKILLAIVIVSLVMGVISAWDWDKGIFEWRGLLSNLSVGLVGSVITYFLIDKLISKNEDDEVLKIRLIRELENPDSGIVTRAAQELRTYGWLTDGSLFGWFLQRANFEGVKLKDADLRGLGLYRCNLTRAAIEERQLCQLNDLRFTIMPDGQLYDGRYCLKGDIDWALSRYDLDFEVITLDEMAKYYDVPTSRFLEGQLWAKQNLPKWNISLPAYLSRQLFD